MKLRQESAISQDAVSDSLASPEAPPAMLISYSRPNQKGPKLSNYSIFRTPPETAPSLLAVLAESLGVLGEVRKTRHVLIIDQTRVHLDKVEGLGSFVELEVVLRDEQSTEDGEAIAKEIMVHLGIADARMEEGAYMDILLSKKV